MGGFLEERVRRLAAVAIAASLLGAAPLHAEPAGEETEGAIEVAELGPSAPGAVAVFAPRVSASLRAVEGGVRIWIVQELRRGGVPVVDPAHTDAVAARHRRPDRASLHGTDVPALAVETEAGAVLLTRIQTQGGQLELWLRAYDARGELIAVGHGSGRLASLGEALVSAFAPVRAALGAGAGDSELPPRLSELGVYQRALERLASGSLAPAWHELEGMESSTADALREDIVARSAAAGVAASERSRLASARGAPDPDWLAIRHQLQRERSVGVLLAGAEHASAGGEFGGALVLFAEAAKTDPGNLDAERGRARMLSALERHADAKAAFERVLSLAPDDVEARLALARNPLLAPAEQARLLVSAGERQSERLDDAGARATLERAAELDPSVRGAARRHVAGLEETLGNENEALTAYDEALAVDAKDHHALAGLGRLRARAGDAAGAGAAFERAVAISPRDADARHGLADALLAQGKAADAIPHLEEVVAKAPRDAHKRSSLARALLAAGQKDAALRVLDPAQVSLEDRPLVLSQAAEIHASQGQLTEARTALEQAVAIEPDEPPLRSALAKVHARAGDTRVAELEEARVATLSGATPVPAAEARESGTLGETPGDTAFAPLAEAFPLEAPDHRRIHRVAWLGLEEPTGWRGHLRAWSMLRAIDPEALEAALRAAFAARFEMAQEKPVPAAAQPSLAELRDFGTERDDVALVNDVLAVDASFVGRWQLADEAGLFDPPHAPLVFELRLLGGRRSGEVYLLGKTVTLEDASAYVRWNPRAAICLGVLAVLLLAPLVRGWGSLVVVLDYDRVRGAQGFFSIELSRRPGKTKQEKKGANAPSKRTKYQRRARWWSRLARDMVGRETHLRWLPARSWYVSVHGLLQDTTSQEVIGNYLEERKIRVSRGKALDVAFDFRRKAAPIEVRILREDKAPPVQARIAVLGVADSLRFVKDATTVFLAPGKHTLLIGVEDRVFERAVDVREMTGQSVGVRIASVEDALFSGCAPAVDAILGGDLLSASRALEKAGKGEIATLVRATHHRLRGDMAEAARCLEQAGRFAEAAELAKQSPQAKRSADLFEKAGDFRQAAEQHARAGDHLKAAQAFEVGFEYAAAIDAYRAGGHPDKALDLLEKTGRFFEAGALARELGDEERAIRSFQQVGVREAEYGGACEALAELFEKRDAFDLAVDMARAAVDAKGADEAPLDTLEGLARLLERAGRSGEALAIWEGIRKRDFHHRVASERVEALRKTVASNTGAATTHAVENATTTAASATARDNRYEVLGELGRGGMGVVQKARDTRLGRVVALKRLPENLKSNATAVQLFLREARAAAALSHPNIVTLFDADQEADGTYYLTMELLEGFALDTVLKKRGKLSPRDALRVGLQIARGLQFAHEKGIVHRDIKTANVFFTRDRNVKIMDFGLAKMTEEVRRSATVIGGTPYYMAPEQAAGEQVDHRADLYALGVTLFELVTGRVPFADGDITYHHRHTAPPDPRSRVPDLPDGFADLILWLMAKAPEQRPTTTAEVVRALEKLLAQLGGGTPSRPGARPDPVS